MAKVAAKTSVREPRKTSSASASTKSNGETIEKACEVALGKLKELDLEPQLQHDIEWCLGSYRADQNPVGLYDMADRALAVFQAEKAKKTKGITAKLVSDLEKALQKRSASN